MHEVHAAVITTAVTWKVTT